jgi:predicted regulator of Ras-like GTPase activity (Roadblock/LC7/MglB family)
MDIQADDPLLTEMRALRDRVTGVTDTALASRDGLIIRADTADLDPDNMAALAAAALGLAQRMAAEFGKGVLRQAVTRSSGGYIAVYAVGAKALLVVVGDVGLDSARLDREAMAAAETIEPLLSPSRPASTATSRTGTAESSTEPLN